MSLQDVLNSRQAGELGLSLSRILPKRLGYKLACLLADRIASNHRLPMVAAIRANQWVVRGEQANANQLDQYGRDTLRHIAHSFFTLFRNMNDPDALQELVVFNSKAEEMINRSQERKHGFVVAGVHMGNFDLVFQAAAMRGLRALALSLPQPNEAVEWQHKYRQHVGIEILPASLGNLRYAISRLKSGETVVTGIDRPVSGLRHNPTFFSHPASVPVHYITLALRAKVPLAVFTSYFKDGVYHILSSETLELKSYSDRNKDIMINAERVLEIAAEFIRHGPHQWTIFQPVWPDLIAEAP